jgi:ABC-type multidrug transport system fused ATPase/permease subunit
MTNAGNKARESDTEVTQNFGRSIYHLNLIQIFQQEPRQQEHFALKAKQSQRDRYLQHRQEIIYSAGVAALFGGLTVAIVGYGVWLIRQDLLSPGELVVFLAYLGQWYGPLNQISQFGSVNADAQAGIHRVYEAMQPKTLLGCGGNEMESNFKTAPTPTFKSPWILEWKNLGFQYDQESEFLFKDFTGSVQTGQIVVLKGASGSGKTTFARLLTHWIGHQEGTILLQNLEIQQWPKRDLRRQFSWANQHPAIWPGTLRENLEMALVLDSQEPPPEDLDSKFHSILEDIGATEILDNLKQGLDTVIGEPGGISLSLGERQRIHLARALLKPAPVLILDEPTSSLDESSALRIRKAIEKRKAQRAILVISHEPLWWEKADRIYDLSDYVGRKK